jgi:arginyl-tRNA synthetase
MEVFAIRDEINSLLTEAVGNAQAKGLIPAISIPQSPIERAANPAHGDYASTLALKLARAASMSPRQIAQALVAELPASPMISQVEVAGPGFINFRLSDAWLAEQVGRIVAAAESFGSVDLGKGASVQVEFVSANPTGPLPAASGRGGSLGDSLARVLGQAGYRVEREYYVNDHGSRVDVLGQSVYARYAALFGRDVPFPADGYHGEYVIDLARHLQETQGDRYLNLDQAEAGAILGKVAIAYFLDGIRSDLDRLGIAYDCWFSETSLYENGEVGRALNMLRERGYVAEREGAVWFASTNLGEDKDNVLVRTSGEPTYFASDIAYHYNKFAERKFDRVIDVWGADHQGHVSRTKTAVGALGINSDRLQIIIHQLVTLKVGGQSVRMGKRSGNIVFLREVLDDVGPDACRFFFVSRSADSHLDFDLDLAKKQSDENPVYYVQYAHARTAGILRHAAGRGLTPDGADLSLLQHPAELALIRKMLELSEVVEMAATVLEPHHLPHYALDLGNVFHSFYTQCVVVSDDVALTKARLNLVLAAKTTLRNTLSLIGVTAPEEMERRERVSD